MLKFLLLILALCATPSTGLAQGLEDEAAYNDTVRVLLIKEGDDGLTPREVQHWAYPALGREDQAAPIDQVLDGVRSLGYEAVPSEQLGGVTFIHLVAVAGSSFDEVTLELRAYFASKGWEYDGWESVVVRKEATP